MSPELISLEPPFSGPAPKPQWLRVRPPGGERYSFIKGVARTRGLHTVCEEARCPNIGECWNGGTATFMLLGDTCTRGCRFCAVKTGDPVGLVDTEEPRKLAEAIAAMRLKYVVLTMVDRDDLSDGGCAHVRHAIEAIKSARPTIVVEALVGDFLGDLQAVDMICNSGLEVFAHNLETVERLQRMVRDQRCNYAQSLAVLKRADRQDNRPYTKTSLMLGLGEHDEEILRTFEDLRSIGVDFLTLGQYLQPTKRHLPVQQYLSPERFDRLAKSAEQMGFRYVASGPLVRSSYRAGEYFVQSLVESDRQGSNQYGGGS